MSLIVGTGVRAHRLSRADRSYTESANAQRAIVDGKAGVTTGESSDSNGLCYEVMFKLSGDGASHVAWFDHDELEVIPERLADRSDRELEIEFIEAEQNALAWAAIGVRSGEHCATRWMEIAGESRAELVRRLPRKCNVWDEESGAKLPDVEMMASIVSTED